MLHKTFSNRFEIKYLVKAGQLNTVRAALGKMMAHDPNAGPGGRYYNYSIYFDSPRYRFYSEKHEGLLQRLKPRLRAHLPAIDAPVQQVYLELKGRHDRTVQKRRTAIGLGMARAMLSGELPAMDSEVSVPEVYDEFEFLARRFGLRPVVSVLYTRTPFHFPLYPNVRLTFDTGIQGSLHTTLDRNRTGFQYVIPPTQALIELKYNDQIPQSVLYVLNRLELEQVTFSKFALALETCFHQFQKKFG
jgi:hypothetical protein